METAGRNAGRFHWGSAPLLASAYRKNLREAGTPGIYESARQMAEPPDEVDADRGRHFKCERQGGSPYTTQTHFTCARAHFSLAIGC